SDKWSHFLAYGALAAGAVQLFRNWPALLGAGLGLVLLGIGLEYAQGSLTDTRMADGDEALANTLGVIAGLATRLPPLHDLLLRLDGRRDARAGARAGGGHGASARDQGRPVQHPHCRAGVAGGGEAQ